MEATSLEEIYASVNNDASTIYVVPLIRHSHKKSDYLYLLYEDLIKGDKYDIKSISVFNHFKLVAGILINRRKAILHYHWLEFQDFKSLLGMPWKIFCIFLFHIFGGNIVWTLHNEFPHDQKYLDLHSYLHKKMAKWADILHVHCASAVPKMKKRLEVNQTKFRLIPHPDFPAEPIDKQEALQNLKSEYECNLSANIPTLLMFGNISRYKQIEKVAELITKLPVESRLLVVGPIKKGNIDLYEELKELDDQSSRIILVASFIPEEHVGWFYSAADFCLFNYREILSSGGYNMAKAYQKPVIAPNLGCLSEEGEKADVHLFNSQEEFKELLKYHLKKFQDG